MFIKNKFKFALTGKYKDFTPEIVSINHPGLSLGVIPIFAGNGTVNKPGELTYPPLTINFLLRDDIENYKKIINWMVTMTDPFENKKAENYENGTIQIYTPDGKLLRFEIQFTSMWPIDTSDIVFEAQTLNDVPEIGSVTFSYDTYKFL